MLKMYLLFCRRTFRYSLLVGIDSVFELRVSWSRHNIRNDRSFYSATGLHASMDLGPAPYFLGKYRWKNIIQIPDLSRVQTILIDI